MIFFLHILEFWHTINITASRDKPKVYDCVTLTCNVVCESPVTVKWVSENGDTVVNTSTITVSEKRSYYWSSAISIIFEPFLQSHEGNYTCISLVGNMNTILKREKEYSLNTKGKAMQINILVYPDKLISYTNKISLFCTRIPFSLLVSR